MAEKKITNAEEEHPYRLERAILLIGEITHRMTNNVSAKPFTNIVRTVTARLDPSTQDALITELRVFVDEAYMHYIKRYDDLWYKSRHAMEIYYGLSYTPNTDSMSYRRIGEKLKDGILTSRDFVSGSRVRELVTRGMYPLYWYASREGKESWQAIQDTVGLPHS